MTDRRAKVEPDELPDDSLEDGHYVVPDRVAHYFRDVLRLEPGDAVELFDGTGRLLEARIQSCRDSRVRVAVLEDRTSDANESPCEIVVCQSLPKRKRWRWVLEKTTELGVSRIVPLETDHSVVDVPDDKRERKLERWRRIVGDAARQSERTRTPIVDGPSSIAAELDATFDGRDLVLHARRNAPTLAGRARAIAADSDAPPAIRLWFGPEGGFSDPEIDLLSEAGVAFCSLGPRILRAETAAVAATTVVQTHLGDLAPRPEEA